jgi:hypothetical protein
MSMQLLHRIDQIEKKIEALEGVEEKFTKRMNYLETVWHRFKRREKIPGKAGVDLKIPPRPKCLDIYLPKRRRNQREEVAANE